MKSHCAQGTIRQFIMPELARLGYEEEDNADSVVSFRFDYPVTLQQGRQKKILLADLVVFVRGNPGIVIEVRKPGACLADYDCVIACARLIGYAPYAALYNGAWHVYDTASKQPVNLPTLEQFLASTQDHVLEEEQKRELVTQATDSLFPVENVYKLTRLMRRCNDIICNIKGYDPARAFDEFCKILFVKMIEDCAVAEGRRPVNRFSRVSVRDMRKQGIDIIQKIWQDAISSSLFQEIFAEAGSVAAIDLPAEAIDRIVSLLEDKSLGLVDFDVKGIAFEEFLSVTYRGGGLGQYFTPRDVVNFIVDLANPAIGERMIDPSCGSGGILIRVYDVVREKILSTGFTEADRKVRLDDLVNCLAGIDWESRAARTCKINMLIHSNKGLTGIYQANALDPEEIRKKVQDRKRLYPQTPDIEKGTFDIVVTNPPFGARDNSESILKHYELGKRNVQKREVLFLERHIQLLRPGGRLVCIVPDGILSNKTDAPLRQFIFEHCIVKALIRLPEDTFKVSGAGARTSVLYAIKKNPAVPDLCKQGDIFFARAKCVGVGTARKPLTKNDLPHILQRFRQFESNEWDGIELVESNKNIEVASAKNGIDTPLEPVINRATFIQDTSCYVYRSPANLDRLNYTWFHPAYFKVMHQLRHLPVKLVCLQSLCEEGYPVCGRTPLETSLEGIPIIKVRNVTGEGINSRIDFTLENEAIREKYRSNLVRKNDILLASSGEATIGRLDLYTDERDAVASGEVTILRIRPGMALEYVLEFLRSDYAQVQMQRHIAGTTGQMQLSTDHIRALQIPLPDSQVQEKIVAHMRRVRKIACNLKHKAENYLKQRVDLLALARNDIIKSLSVDDPGAS